jgi:hypothetical protein
MNTSVLIPYTYPRPKRLPLGTIPTKDDVRRDRYLSPGDVESLFRLKVLVEEKMDGKPTRFLGDNGRFILFVEDMHRVHTIRYRLPARYALYDIFDSQLLRFLSHEGKSSVFASIRNHRISVSGCNNFHFFQVPLLALGHFQLRNIPSFLGHTHYPPGAEPVFAEGVVVKPNRELYLPEFITGKLVRAECLEGIKISYLRLPFRKNMIDPRTVPFIDPK